MLKSTLSLLLISLVSAHMRMDQPPIRGSQAPHWGFCTPERGCEGPCEATFAETDYTNRQRPTYQRGQNIPVTWLRLNHPGGFVRLSLVPTSQSGSQESFDQNVLKYGCIEVGCSEDSPSPFHGYLAGPNHSGPDSKGTCKSTLTLPTNVPDGEYTLQFIWFAGGMNQGNRFAPFGNFYSCSDFIINGGAPLTQEKAPVLFEGGDVAVADKTKCRYWGRNDEKSCAKGHSLDPALKDVCPYGPPRVGAPAAFTAPNSPYNNANSNNSQGYPVNAPNQADSQFPPNGELYKEPEEWAKQHPVGWVPPADYKWTPPQGYNPALDNTNYGSK